MNHSTHWPVSLEQNDEWRLQRRYMQVEVVVELTTAAATDPRQVPARGPASPKRSAPSNGMDVKSPGRSTIRHALHGGCLPPYPPPITFHQRRCTRCCTRYSQSPEHYFPVYGALGTTDPDRAVSPSPAEKEVTLVRARKAFHSEIAAKRRNILVN
jgi:hypothetical protein